ncbi:MAG: DUF1540 domain-containing protein [Clostridia bacterium]|nr:DUF1540 domain-containing protein [Clostridia bacterium]
MSQADKRCVSCSVCNCEFHEEPCHCTADVIEISNSKATKSRETLCSTFKPNANCKACK